MTTQRVFSLICNFVFLVSSFASLRLCESFFFIAPSLPRFCPLGWLRENIAEVADLSGADHEILEGHSGELGRAAIDLGAVALAGNQSVRPESARRVDLDVTVFAHFGVGAGIEPTPAAQVQGG